LTVVHPNTDLSVMAVIQLLLSALLAGLAGTLAMAVVMSAITKTGLANADMVRAIGSIVTRSLDRALLVGGALYTAGGVVFALLYAVALSLFPVTGFWPTFGASTVLGFAHGFVMSFVLVAVVAENHPLEQFRDSGFRVALAHVLGHVAYGASVGAVLGALSQGAG
jgi:hypothetical protein